MNLEYLDRAYAIIGNLTPMLADCGGLCGAACCRPDADGQGGVYLFPGEAERLGGRGWVAEIRPVDFAPILICDGHCERDARPLGCRIFPLTPVRGRNGRWTVRLDARARAMCPLANRDIGALYPAFARAVRDALRHIARDPEGDAFLEAWYRLEEAYRAPLW